MTELPNPFPVNLSRPAIYHPKPRPWETLEEAKERLAHELETLLPAASDLILGPGAVHLTWRWDGDALHVTFVPTLVGYGLGYDHPSRKKWRRWVTWRAVTRAPAILRLIVRLALKGA